RQRRVWPRHETRRRSADEIRPRTGRPALNRNRSRSGAGASGSGSVQGIGNRRAESARRATEEPSVVCGFRPGKGTPRRRRLLDSQERLDRRWRRLGLRHRRGRSGSCPRFRHEGQHPRARHRGLFQHWWPDVQGDAALEAISYGNVYVARVAMGGSDTQTLKALLEAEEHPGPSLLIAYSHCIAHGYDMMFGMNQQKSAVLCGYWPLFRYNPALLAEGRNPLQLDSRAPSMALENYAYQEARYSMLVRSNPEAAKELLREAKEDVDRRWNTYANLAATPVTKIHEVGDKAESIAPVRTTAQ